MDLFPPKEDKAKKTVTVHYKCTEGHQFTVVHQVK